MQIPIGQDGPEKTFKAVPWALEMAHKTKTSNDRQNLMKIVSYLIIALGLIGGSIYVAFIRGRKRNKETV